MLRRFLVTLGVAVFILPVSLVNTGCDDKKAEIPTNQNMALPKSVGGGPAGGKLGAAATGGGGSVNRAE